MPLFRRRSRGSSAPARPAYAWGWSTFALDAFVNIPAASSVLLGSIIATTAQQVLVERALGTIVWVSDQTALVEEQIGRFGAIVVSADAAAAGVASIPDPDTDAGAPWWLYQTFASKGPVLSTGFAEIAIDGKARRILNTNEVISFVVTNQHATHAFDFIVNLRILARIR